MTVDFTTSPYWSALRDEFSDRTEKILFWDEIAVPLLLAWANEGKRSVLDAGCGTGRQVERLCNAGFDARGITYQPEEVAAFNARRPDLVGRSVEADVHAIPHHDATFDFAICWDVLEHTLAPLHVLGELRRVVKPGGYVLLFIPGEMWQNCAYHIIVPNIRQMTHLMMLSRWRIQTVYDCSHIQSQSAIYVGCNDIPDDQTLDLSAYHPTYSTLDLGAIL